MVADVTTEPSRSRKGDWVYALADTPTRRITGAKLGSAYTRRGITDAVGSPTRRRATPETAKRIVGTAKDAIEVRDLGELREFARATDFVSRNRVGSLAEMDRAIARARSRSEATRLTTLRKSCKRYGLLPKTSPKPETSRKPSPVQNSDSRRSYDDDSHQRHHEQSRPSRSRKR